jgi:hypothetical protein
MVKKYSQRRSKNKYMKKSQKSQKSQKKQKKSQNKKNKQGGHIKRDNVSLTEAVNILRNYYQQNLK